MTTSAQSNSAVRLVLASASPRRKDLLSQLGLKFEIIASDIDESIDDRNPASFVRRLSLEKAQAVAHGCTNGRKVDTQADAGPRACSAPQKTLVLGADTIVVCDDEILGKPTDHENAFTMLWKLSGRAHEVLTGVSLVEISPDGSIASETIHQTSRVFFRNLQPEEIHSYINTGEPADKAGAYALQGIAACFVERIDGCYTNVIGLPVPDTVSLLRRHGITVLGIPEAQR